MIQLKRILVATDFGEASDAALSYGRAFARMFDASLHVLHVAENVFTRGIGADTYVAVFPDLQKDVEEAARRRLEQQIADGDPVAVKAVPVVLTSNTPALAIVSYAKEADVDLIVMGTHGRGAMAHLLMGSVAERVVRTAPCPVLTLRHPEHEFVVPDTLASTASA